MFGFSRVHLRALKSEELKQLDVQAERLGIPTIVLMENAGRGAAEILAKAMSESGPFDASNRLPRVLIVCGPGNNGGDGAVVARHLDAAGLASVEVVWITPPDALRGLAPIQYQILHNSGLVQRHITSADALAESINQADWLVDALFGTGLTRAIEAQSLAGQTIELMNQSEKPILALDIPSGLVADSGEVPGVCIEAEITASFVSTKLSYALESTKHWTGHVEVVDIGLPRLLITPLAIAAL